MRGPEIEPFLRVVGGDTAANLQPVRVSGQGGTSRGIVTGAEFDDVPATQAVLSVFGCEPFGRVVCHKVGVQPGAVVSQSAADDLFHAAVVQVDTGAESGHARSYFSITSFSNPYASSPIASSRGIPRERR